MFKIDVLTDAFVAWSEDMALNQIPFATANALNDAMFAVRDGWKTRIQDVFDRPTQLTINAVLYKKASKANLVAEVFLRNEAQGGTPPSRYLLSEVTGGQRAEKPFEYLLQRTGILAANEFLVVAKNYPVDAFGNVSAGVQNAILSDLQSSPDAAARSTPTTRAKRANRKKISKRAIYFISAPNLSASQGHHQPLIRGIYERTKFASGSAVRMVFAIVQGAPRYKKRFDAQALGRELFNQSFPTRFKVRFAEALASAKKPTGGE